ncbi:MAG: hypothetical protein NVS1B6_07720 [Steroidobacteraceae bacterium]
MADSVPSMEEERTAAAPVLAEVFFSLKVLAEALGEGSFEVSPWTG